MHRNNLSFRRAITLLEVMIALIVVAILAILGMASFAKVRNKAEAAQCAGNLKTLYLGSASYVTDHEKWPQIKPDPNLKKFTKEWIAALRPYKVDERSWICPTIQRKLKSPDLSDVKNQRMDYMPTPFGPHPNKPYKWSTQPWFLEAGNSHGNGNLMIFMDGSIRPFGDMAKLPSR